MADKQEQLEVEEFIEIGGSPTPGITLRQVLRGHTDAITASRYTAKGEKVYD